MVEQSNLPDNLIETNDDLDVVVATFQHTDQVALDTEFHAERRYRPELLLVQIAQRDGPVWTIDPLRVDLRRLAPALQGREWLAHGARWDIDLLHEATGARPRAVLDTQILAAFAGHHFPARLSDLSERVLGVPLDKGATLTDWSRRPLSSAQLHYAREDVAILFPIVDALIADFDRTESHERLSWARQAGEELIEEALATPDADATWRALDIAPTFDGPTRQALHVLFQWREEEARLRNTPTHFVLAPSLALDLARRRPTSIDGLKSNRRMPAGLIKRYGNDLLACIAQAAKTKVPPVASRYGSPALVHLLHAWRELQSAKLNIAPTMLLRDTDVLALSQIPDARLCGWRGDLLGDNLKKFFSGERGLFANGSEVVLRKCGL